MDPTAEDRRGEAVDELFESVLQLSCQSHDPGLYGRVGVRTLAGGG
jgi:hypothetical protein